MVKTALRTVAIASLAVWTASAASPPNLDKTLAAQHELVAAQPWDAEAYNDLGNLLVLDGQLQEAREAYARAIELAPQSTLPRFNLGILLHQLGRSREAVAELRGLLEIDGRHARTYYQLGMIYESRKQRSAALEHYARAFALDPQLTFAHHNPHIIDNGFATEAILMSKRFAAAPTSEIPRLYGQPERIADLMLQRTEPEGAAPAAEAAEATPRAEGEPAAVTRAGETAPAGVEDPDEDPDEEDDERVRPDDGEAGERSGAGTAGAGGRRQLTPADLRSGSSVGQASSTPRRRGIGVSTSRPSGRSESVQRDRPLPDDRSTAAPGATPVTPRPRYRPASRLSTGRLELKLLPEEPAERLADARPAAVKR